MAKLKDKSNKKKKTEAADILKRHIHTDATVGLFIEWILDFNFSRLIYSKSKLNWAERIQNICTICNRYIYLFIYLEWCTHAHFNLKKKQQQQNKTN